MQNAAATSRTMDEQEQDRAPMLSWLLAPAVVLALAGMARAESHEEVFITHGVSNFGELAYGPDIDHLDYVNPDAPKGGEISLWSQGTFDSFNVFTRQGVPASNTSVTYEAMLVATADDPYGMYCYMCTTMEYPESRDWVIFNLRDDVTFADGTPMTAEDVAFSFNLFMEQGIVEYRDVFSAYLDNIEVLDPYRVKFTFTEDAPRREVIGFAGGSPVFSKAWFEETGARLDEASDVPFMSTGAYQLADYENNQYVIYERNPDHWGADHPLQVGQNNFDTIRIEYFADAAAAMEAFKAGEYTFRIENSSKEWATAYDFPAMNNGWVIREEVPDGTIPTAQSFIFNLRDPKFQNPAVREAIRLMFNFEWSNETLFYGLYTRVNSFWENSPLEATGTPSEAEIALLQPLVDEGLLDASILTDEVVMAPESRPDRNTDRDNLRLASDLLEEAGWPIGEDGLRRNEAGEVLSVEFLEYSPAFDRIVNPYIENLARLGVDATLERVDTAQYIDRRRPPVAFDMTNHGFAMVFEPGTNLRQWFDSSTAADSSRNLMALQNEAVDRLIPHVIEAETLDELTVAVHALDRVLRAEGFWVPQWYKDVHTVAYYDMYRHPDPVPPLALGHLSFWWYDAERGAELDAAGAF